MAYLVIAYPELCALDFDTIQNYRKDNDALFFNVVAPHFTLVFPVFDMTEEAFISEIQDKVDGFRQFTFVLRCATINKDAFKSHYHTFLVPDEGYSQFVKLHDKLYSEKLKNNLRLDIDFIPHIGIGNAEDQFVCKQMVDHWNKTQFAISGKISELSVIKYEHGIITPIEKIKLQ